ncbi:hypothetical protein [Bradyrhizobium sp.]|uniref:hypothetical protein n=1 Tax=Bradyrhizobium sp. TaxID=376 RepID=UPI0039E56D16
MSSRGLWVLVLLLCGVGSVARAGSLNKADPWDPRHIDGLPPEIQQYITGLCKGPPKAQRDFATFNPHERRWRINIEYLHCDGLAGTYRQGGKCLDIDFIETGSHYRPARKTFADCGF